MYSYKNVTKLIYGSFLLPASVNETIDTINKVKRRWLMRVAILFCKVEVLKKNTLPYGIYNE